MLTIVIVVLHTVFVCVLCLWCYGFFNVLFVLDGIHFCYLFNEFVNNSWLRFVNAKWVTHEIHIKLYSLCGGVMVMAMDKMGQSLELIGISRLPNWKSEKLHLEFDQRTCCCGTKSNVRWREKHFFQMQWANKSRPSKQQSRLIDLCGLIEGIFQMFSASGQEPR